MALLLALLWAAGSCAATQQSPDLSALHFFQRGNSALAAEDYAGAIRMYQQALALDDQSAETHYNLGLAYFRAGAHGEAVTQYLRAAELAPQRPETHFNLALAYDRLYNTQAAHSHYNRFRTLTLGDAATAQTAASSAAQPVKQTRTTSASRRRRNTEQAAAQKPSPVARQRPAPRAVAATQGKTRPPIQPPQAESLLGETRKWWTEDQFIQKP